MSARELLEAAGAFADAFGADSSTAGDVAPLLTCGELDALCDLLAAAGAIGLAHVWMAAHAAGDEPGDCHVADAAGEPCSHGRAASVWGCA